MRSPTRTRVGDAITAQVQETAAFSVDGGALRDRRGQGEPERIHTPHTHSHIYRSQWKLPCESRTPESGRSRLKESQTSVPSTMCCSPPAPPTLTVPQKASRGSRRLLVTQGRSSKRGGRRQVHEEWTASLQAITWKTQQWDLRGSRRIRDSRLKYQNN